MATICKPNSGLPNSLLRAKWLTSHGGLLLAESKHFLSPKERYSIGTQRSKWIQTFEWIFDLNNTIHPQIVLLGAESARKRRLPAGAIAAVFCATSACWIYGCVWPRQGQTWVWRIHEALVRRCAVHFVVKLLSLSSSLMHKHTWMYACCDTESSFACINTHCTPKMNFTALWDLCAPPGCEGEWPWYEQEKSHR